VHVVDINTLLPLNKEREDQLVTKPLIVAFEQKNKRLVQRIMLESIRTVLTKRIEYESTSVAAFQVIRV
jgi:hypothetical protein